jgi:hypothetical protein
MQGVTHQRRARIIAVSAALCLCAVEVGFGFGLGLVVLDADTHDSTSGVCLAIEATIELLVLIGGMVRLHRRRMQWSSPILLRATRSGGAPNGVCDCVCGRRGDDRLCMGRTKGVGCSATSPSYTASCARDDDYHRWRHDNRRKVRGVCGNAADHTASTIRPLTNLDSCALKRQHFDANEM